MWDATLRTPSVENNHIWLNYGYKMVFMVMVMMVMVTMVTKVIMVI